MKMESIRKLRQASTAALDEKKAEDFNTVLSYTHANIEKPLSNDFIESQKSELFIIEEKEAKKGKIFGWIAFFLLCCAVVPLSSLITGMPYKELTGNPVFLMTVIGATIILLSGFGGCLLAYMLADPVSPSKLSKLFQPLEKTVYLELKSLADELNEADQNRLSNFMITLKKEQGRDMVLAEFLAWLSYVTKIENDTTATELDHIYTEMYQGHISHLSI